MKRNVFEKPSDRNTKCISTTACRSTFDLLEDCDDQDWPSEAVRFAQVSRPSFDYTLTLGFSSADPKAKYPLCLEGERACPSEDCGGPWGYAEFLAAIADPEHEQHDDMVKWGGAFDSEAFDVKAATKEMRKVK